ncbi:MAG: FG-GAP repeat protein [bacterium]
MLICRTPLHNGSIGLSLLIVASCLLVAACAKSGQHHTADSSTASAAPLTSPAANQRGRTPPNTGAQTSETSRPTSEPAATTQLAATLAEAKAAVNRIYRTSLAVNPNRNGGSILVGDFNNDGSQDIAVIVRPAKGTLETLNNPYAPWILEDLSKIDLPIERNGLRVLPPKPGPVKVEENDELLVIVHGYQQSGWRNPQAQQSYLLRHAVGDKLKTQSLKTMMGDVTRQSPHSHVGGDVIKEKVANKDGFVYWTGAKYAWYREK